jgi:hypothetical protein
LAINEHSVACFSLGMGNDHSIKFAADRVPKVTGVNGAVRRVPGQCAHFGGVPISVPVTEPGGCIARFRIAVPDNGLTIFRALIGAIGEHAARA